MKETMGRIIKRLRKEANFTQEELAEQLNISSAAVSKWENEICMPDISQIVPIANLFHVSTDVLFGTYGMDHDEKLDEVLGEIFRLTDHCPDGEEARCAITVFEKYREALALFPNNATVLVNFLAFYKEAMYTAKEELRNLLGESEFKKLKTEMKRYAELVIKYSTSIDDILSAKNALIYICEMDKNYEEAIEIAKTFPELSNNNKDCLLASLYHSAGEKDKEKKQHCYNISKSAEILFHNSALLGHLYMQESKYEEALYCYSFLRQLLDAMYKEEKYRPPFVHSGYVMYHFSAICNIKLGRFDDALTDLEQGVDYILTQAKYFNIKTELSIPLLIGKSFRWGYDGDAKYEHLYEKLINLISAPEFDVIADHPRYQTLAKIIEKSNA